MGNGPDRQFVAAHLIAFAAAGALVAVPGVHLWHALWTFVLGYNVGIPLYFRSRGQEDVFAMWAFVLPLSVFQVVPDWFLCEELGVLVFPSAPDPLAVPLYMAGLWAPPLLITTYVGERIEATRGERTGFVAAAIAGLIMFAGSELLLTSIPIWEPVDVYTVGGMAPYILLPEALLCASTLYAFRKTRNESFHLRVAAAGLVSCLYLGAAGASHLFEGWIRILLV